MQQMNEPPPAAERSRRRPPRRRSDEAIPIPEAPARSPRPKTVKLHQVLGAYQRAVLEAVDLRLGQVADAASEAARQAVAEALADRPGGPGGDDVARGTLAYVDERFQSMSLRLRRIEQAVRHLAARSAAGNGDGDLTARLDALVRAVRALVAEHRSMAEDLGRRTGQGVVAIGRVLRRDVEGLSRDLARLNQGVAGLEEGLDGVQASVRSVHRTLAWDGMRAGRPERADPT
jgi:hypothetical protein